MFFLIIFSILATQIFCACPNPPPAAHFTIQRYLGLWYQIAKYQTAGGAYFEKDCTCTKIDVSQIGGTTYAYQSCIKNGKLTGVNATLLPTEYPGKFIQKISVNKVGYWVIQLDDQTAIEFDCQDVFGVKNYCIHIMSRKKTLDREKLNQLAAYALSLGLNTAGLPMTITEQANCKQGKDFAPKIQSLRNQ